MTERNGNGYQKMPCFEALALYVFQSEEPDTEVFLSRVGTLEDRAAQEVCAEFGVRGQPTNLQKAETVVGKRLFRRASQLWRSGVNARVEGGF